MCIFNKVVERVYGTKLFVSPTADGNQFTIYENVVDLMDEEESNAMILPFPAGPVELVDLTDFPNLFEDMDDCFPEPPKPRATLGDSGGLKSAVSAPALPVFNVGSYDVSIAETLEDVVRIDESVFTVAPNIQELLREHYETGWGFLICKFRESSKKHPLGYVHSLRDTLFVPTRHEHGTNELSGNRDTSDSNSSEETKESAQSKESAQTEESAAWFDHIIYSVNTTQKAGSSALELMALNGTVPKKGVVEVLGSLTVSLAEFGCIRREKMLGEFPNEDQFYPLVEEEEMKQFQKQRLNLGEVQPWLSHRLQQIQQQQSGGDTAQAKPSRCQIQ